MRNFIPSDSRGGADHGWLKTRFSFSFAEYYDPDRMGFGALRVINDDQIGGESGFGTHSHQNMEIITIMMEGTLTHKDSMGTEATITLGEVQVMSAGTGVLHSEYNATTEMVRLFQIWIEPKQRNIAPRYDQKLFEALLDARNALVPLVSPDGKEETLSINQDAWIYYGHYTENKSEEYTVKPNNGVYVFVVEGGVKIDEQLLNGRDALEISDEENFSLEIQAGTKVLIFEVPLF